MLLNSNLTDIENRLNSDSVTERIDIKAESVYITPCDGYVYLINASGQTGTVSIAANCAIGGNMGHFSCFVHKGTRLSAGGTMDSLYFCKLQY